MNCCSSGGQVRHLPLPGRGVRRQRLVAADGRRPRRHRVRKTPDSRRVFRQRRLGPSRRRLAAVSRRVAVSGCAARLRRYQQVTIMTHNDVNLLYSFTLIFPYVFYRGRHLLLKTVRYIVEKGRFLHNLHFRDR